MNIITNNQSTDSMYAQNDITRQNLFNEETGGISSEAVQVLTMTMTKIIDDRIEQRFVKEDIAKVYTAKVVDADIGTINEPYVQKSTDTDGDTVYKIVYREYIGVKSITVTFDDSDSKKKFELTLSGSLVKSLPVKSVSVNSSGTVTGQTAKYVKVCTYDGINFHLLHDI